MKTITKWVFTGVLLVFTLNASAQETDPDQDIYDELRLQMERACPAIWEDLGADMDTDSLGSDIWSADQADKDEFILLLTGIMVDSTAEQIVAMADDVATVATECASHRVALLDALISKTPRDVLLAMDAVNRGLNKSIEYLDGGWSVGDVRMTGRLEPQDGWVFLIGQTIGNVGSGADLEGEEYNELFELAKNWAPNLGTEEWSANAVVTLPDTRGRVAMAPDNMGGTPAGIIDGSTTYQVGSAVGKQQGTLTSAQLIKHTHTMRDAGSHSHSVGSDNHHHAINVVTYDADTGATRYLSSNTDHGGPNVGVTSSISADTHHHSLSAAPHHKHTVDSAGSENVPYGRMQPSIVFNFEMKY